MNWEESVIWLKNQPDKKDLVRACFYDDSLIEAAKRYHESTEWVELVEFLPKKIGSVLDIGAGRGISSYAFAKDGWVVTALEPDESDIVGAGAIQGLVEEGDVDISIVKEWGEKLPFADESFDVVYMRQALHHAYNLEEFCKEAGRVLKSGGLFIATREHVISKKDDLDMFLKSHPLHKFYGGENAFMLNEYIEAIEKGNMQIIHILRPFESDINLFPYSLRDFKMKILKYMEIVYSCIPFIFTPFSKKIFSRPGRIYTFIAKKI